MVWDNVACRIFLYFDSSAKTWQNLKTAYWFHRIQVSIVTYVLANIFASLFAKGFGTIEEEQDTTASIETTQDATETGMDEGIGVNDVSDQIENEDQLLGTDKVRKFINKNLSFVLN